MTAVSFTRDCEHVVRALWDYLDGTLGVVEMSAIDDHLADCEHCREHERFERALLDHIRGLRRDHADPGALRERVLGALRKAGLGSAER